MRPTRFSLPNCQTLCPPENSSQISDSLLHENGWILFGKFSFHLLSLSHGEISFCEILFGEIYLCISFGYVLYHIICKHAAKIYVYISFGYVLCKHATNLISFCYTY